MRRVRLAGFITLGTLLLCSVGWGMLRRTAWLGWGLLFLLLLCLAPGQPAYAASFAVNSTADATDANPGDGVCETATGNGVCTLRAAIQEANARSGAHIITVPVGTYTLIIAGTGENAAATGDLDITGDLTISGAGAATTIVQAGTSEGSGIDRVFHIHPGVMVTITDLTIQNGSAPGFQEGGGAILNFGTVELNSSTVKDNTGSGIAGGIANNGTMTLNNTIVTSHGGGNYAIGNNGTMTLNSSSVNNNETAILSLGTLTLNLSAVNNNSLGGGLHNAGTATLNQSTLSGNSNTLNGGGGIHNFGTNATMTLNSSTVSNNTAGGSFSGGGIYSIDGSLTITNSTVSHNTAAPLWGGGIFIHTCSTVTITNSTVSHNTAARDGGGIFIDLPCTVAINNSTIASNTASSAGGGLFVVGTTSLKNTIVADNTPDNCSKHDAGTLTSSGHNLSSDSSCPFSASGDSNNIDPMLGPLADNGGPTRTHALGPGSPAIDAGNPAEPGSGGDACAATDQRGLLRPQDAACDIGAFEATVLTPVGDNVEVYPFDTTTETTPVTLTFSSVTQDGYTNLTTSGTGPATPSGFQLGTPLTYYDITTTASFSGAVAVCIDYSGISFSDESQLKLFHFDGSQWVDRTTTLDTEADVICGSVDSLSPFTVFQKATGQFSFSGFFQPVDNPGPGPAFVFNKIKAGQAIPVKFSLSGNQGLNIFAAGYPGSVSVNCNTAGSVDNIEETVTAGQSSLSYDAASDRYTYVWKTNIAWGGSCRKLIVRLSDGIDHVAYFNFTK